MKKLMATAAIAAVALVSPALAQTPAPHRNQSNEGIQSSTQQQRLDGGDVIPHGASGRDTVNLGGHRSQGAAVRALGQGARYNRPHQARRVYRHKP
jgi:hypothetical protein